MKLFFKGLTEGQVYIDLDGNGTYETYDLNDIQDGLDLDENLDYSKIKVKANSKVFSNLQVIKNFEIQKVEYNHELDENEQLGSIGGTIQVGQPFYIWGNYYGETCLTFTRDLKIGDIVLTLMLGQEYNGEKSALQFDEIIGIRSYDDNGEISGIDVRGIEWSLQRSNQIELYIPIGKYGNYLGA